MKDLTIKNLKLQGRNARTVHAYKATMNEEVIDVKYFQTFEYFKLV